MNPQKWLLGCSTWLKWTSASDGGSEFRPLNGIEQASSYQLSNMNIKALVIPAFVVVVDKKEIKP
jgi:hypothetical protein